MDALKLVYDYLSNRKYRVKINETFRSWKDVEYGVAQGSILGLLLFNVQLCDLFYFLGDQDIASYVDNTAIYTVKENKESAINALETSSLLLFKSLSINFMKANSGKSHLLQSCSEPSAVVINGCSIESYIKEVLLGITIQRNSKLERHAKNLMLSHALHNS